MPYVLWDKSFSVNNIEIDNQHKKLFELINKLHSSLQAGQGNTVLKPVLMELVDYVKVHFAQEEKLMKEKNYPDYDKHKQKHEEYIVELKVFLKKYKGRTPLLAREILLYLGKWVSEHIKGEDFNYSSFLKD